MENQITVEDQFKVARVAGWMYLFGMAASVFAEAARTTLYVGGNAGATAANIVAKETLFRVAIGADLLTYISVVVLTWSLFILLKPVNSNLAYLGTFLRLMEVTYFSVVMVDNFVVLQLLRDVDYLKVFEKDQVDALSRVAILTRANAYNAGFALLSFGTGVFNYLLYKSNYIPRPLAVLGIVSSVIFFSGSFTMLIYPGTQRYLFPYVMIPMGLFETTMGFWLSIKGARINRNDKQQVANS